MKRSLLLIFALLLLGSAKAIPPQTEGLLLKKHKNVLKINLLPLYFKIYSLQYERTFLRNFSICLQAGYNAELRLDPYINRVLDTVSNANLIKVRSKVSLNELTISSNAYITPELRIYLSIRGAPNGFYIAPYLRFSSSTIHATFLYKDSNNAEIPITFKGKVSAMLPGAMFGYQQSFFKRIVIDFWLIGLQFGSTKASFDAYADYTKVDKQGFANFVQGNMKYGTATVNIDSNTHALLEYTGKLGSERVCVLVSDFRTPLRLKGKLISTAILIFQLTFS
jgi:hypothetical protein